MIKKKFFCLIACIGFFCASVKASENKSFEEQLDKEFTNLCQEFADFTAKTSLSFVDKNQSLYAFEQTKFKNKLISNAESTLFDLYQFIDKMVKHTPSITYITETFNKKPFQSFILPPAQYHILFDNNQLKKICSLVHNVTFIFSDSQDRKICADTQKAMDMIDKGLTSEKVTEILQKIDSFLSNPGLYIKIRNRTFNRRMSKNLEGAPGSRRNSLTPSSSVPNALGSKANSPLLSSLSLISEDRLSEDRKRRRSIPYSGGGTTSPSFSQWTMCPNKGKRRDSLSSHHSRESSPSALLSSSPLSSLSRSIPSFSLDSTDLEEQFSPLTLDDTTAAPLEAYTLIENNS